MLKKTTKLLGWVVVVSLFCYGLFGCWQMTKTLWPGLHDDACCYSTVAINRASGLGNHFHVFSGFLIRGEGSTNFNWHGQLYYPVAAALLSTPDYEGFLGFVHWSNLAAYLLAFVVFSWQSHRSLQIGWLGSSMIGVAGAYAMVAVLHYLQGRPEHGIPVMLLVFQLAALVFRWPSLPAPLAGLRVGLAGAVSPLPGAVLGLASALAMALSNSDSKNLFRKSFQLFVFAGFGWAGASSLAYDGNILDLIKNSSGEAGLYLFHPIEIVMYWVRLNLAPCLGLLFGAGVVVACAQAFQILRNSRSGLQKLIICAAILPLGYLVWKHGISWAATNYCFLPFFPSLACWILQGARFSYSESVEVRRAVLVATGWVVFAGMVLPGAGSLRTILLQDALIKRGVSFQQARTEINEIKKSLRPGEVIGIHGWAAAQSEVIFDGPPWYFRSAFFPFLTGERLLGVKKRFFLVLQFTHANPQEVNGYKLVKNRFQPAPVELFGFQLKSTTPGFGYALYERDEEALKKLSLDSETAEDFR